LLVAVNYAAHRSQCRVRLPIADLAGTAWRLQDLLGPDRYEREGNVLQAHGLYLDEGPWKARVFLLTRSL
jgi:hypothetical protein